MRCVIIIPTLNPDKKIIKLVNDLKKENFNMIVVVDDGSNQEYSSVFNQLENLDCKIVHHTVNQGKGQAIKTGISFANTKYKDFIGYITVDGDYQHLPKDVKNVALKMEEDDSKIVLGERNFKGKEIPIKSKIGNIFSSIFLKLQTGVYIEDTQTGLRGIPNKFSDFAMNVEGSRYEYEMNFLRDAISNKISFEMLKIETIYENNNKGSHFRPLKDAYLIYEEFIKFTIIAILSAIIDVGLFWILNKLFYLLLCNSISVKVISAISNILARITSGLFNFTMNKEIAFNSKNNTKTQIWQYFILFVIQMCVSTFLVSLISNFSINIVLAKMIIDICIFFVNYYIEKIIIFKNKNKSSKKKY